MPGLLSGIHVGAPAISAQGFSSRTASSLCRQLPLAERKPAANLGARSWPNWTCRGNSATDDGPLTPVIVGSGGITRRPQNAFLRAALSHAFSGGLRILSAGKRRFREKMDTADR